MKRILLLICCILFMAGGCSAWKEYSENYLKADELDGQTFPEAWETYKEDYLK
ncbi:MAG: hypothetical protein KC713_02170 [Candidatus Omnitrophica bacterium]|nr:hypothetical protein [Candidatus Omnitrophota bacterium]